MSEYLKFGIQKFINGFTVIFLIYILTEKFDAEDYGRYVVFSTYSLAIANIIYQWQLSIVARFWQKEKGSVNAYLCQIKNIVHISAVIVVIFTYLYWENYLKEIIIIGFTAISAGLFMLQQQIKNSESNFREYRAIGNVRNILLLLGILLALNLTNDIYKVSFVLGFSYLLTALIYRRNNVIFLDGEKNKNYLDYGKYFFVMSMLTVAIDYFDKIYISHMVGMTNLGRYAIIQTVLQQSVGAIMSVIYTYKFPEVLKCFDDKLTHSPEKKIKEMSFLVLYVGLLVSFLLYESSIFFLRHEGLNIHNEYNVLIILLLIATYLACFKGYIIDSVHVLTKNSKAILISTLITAVISVALNLILIWKFGNIGAALSSVIAFTVGAVFSWLIRLDRSLISHKFFIFPLFLIFSLGANVGIDFYDVNSSVAFISKLIIYFIPLTYLLKLRHV